jgi:serine/threonine protein kinase
LNILLYTNIERHSLEALGSHLQQGWASMTLEQDYEFLERLGSGGMADVWKARRVADGQLVAIKVLRDETVQALHRFKQEVQIIEQISHPNIVSMLGHWEERITPSTTYGANNARPRAALIMEYMPGGNASSYTKPPLLPLHHLSCLANQVAAALDFLHQNGIVHRDLKPANLLLDERGNVYLSDFGISRRSDATGLTASDQVVGTWAYIAPELWRGERATPATDIYAFGILLYQFLCGELPFTADHPYVIANMHLVQQPTPPSQRQLSLNIPPQVESAVLRALAKQPYHRQTTARAVADAINLLPDYRLVRVLRSACASQPLATYLAEQRSRNSASRFVTLTFADVVYVESPTLQRLFERAKWKERQLVHPNILQTLDYDISPYYGVYYVSEPIKGFLLDQFDQLNYARIAYIMQRVAQAVQYGADHGVFHGELRVENIAIKPDGSYALTPFTFYELLDEYAALYIGRRDFSTQRHYFSITNRQNALYNAPEFWQENNRRSVRSLVYELGVMLFRLLTGEFPYKGSRAANLSNQHCNAPIPDPRALRPDLPPVASEIIRVALAKNEAERFASPAAFAEALDLLIV